MEKIVDLDLLRQAKTDSLRIYEAIRRAETLDTEIQHIAALAEDLLRQAGLAYLTDSIGDIIQEQQSSASNPESMVSAYIRVQQAYVDLKGAMYQLGKKLLEDGTTTEARLILGTLLKIDPNYIDVQTLLRQELMTGAKSLFEQKEWEAGRTVLKEGLYDKNVRLEFLSSFLKEKNSVDGLRALQQVEPNAGKLASFQKALRIADQLAEVEGAWNALPALWEPTEPTFYSWEDQESRDRQNREYRSQMARYRSDLARYGKRNDELEEQVYSLRNALEQAILDVQAELSSII